jgi:capsular polysaccharide biosynthesis protein
VFQNEVTDIYNLENVAVIDSAEVQTEAYNINIARDSIIFFAVGFVLTVGIYFVIYYFDTSIKSVEEVEKELGVPVIGTIPLSRKGKK